MKILLTIDGSDYNQAVVEELGKRLLPSGTKIHIVSAFDISPIVLSIPTPGGAIGNYYEDVKIVAQNASVKATKDAAKYLHDKNSTLAITTTAIEGSPKMVILKEAETFGADLIVVGSHGHGAVASFLLGSVSQAVALHAKCSVEIVRKKVMLNVKNKSKF